MKRKRATLRVGGHHAVDITVRHSVSAYELLAILVMEVDATDLTPWGYKRVRDAIADHLKYKGSSEFDPSDYAPENAAEVCAWAVEQLRTAYPQFPAREWEEAARDLGWVAGE